MRVRIELTQNPEEEEVVIRCGRADATVEKIRQYVLQQTREASPVTFFKDDRAYYFPLDRVLFFETDGERIYAHTADDAYRIKYRLYELEELLPDYFVRAAKSAIVNVLQIYSVQRNLSASSLVSFKGSHKQLYVSRFYFKELRRRLDERARLGSDA